MPLTFQSRGTVLLSRSSGVMTGLWPTRICWWFPPQYFRGRVQTYSLRSFPRSQFVFYLYEEFILEPPSTHIWNSSIIDRAAEYLKMKNVDMQRSDMWKNSQIQWWYVEGHCQKNRFGSRENAPLKIPWWYVIALLLGLQSLRCLRIHG